jgi:hypothetical protein
MGTTFSRRPSARRANQNNGGTPPPVNRSTPRDTAPIPATASGASSISSDNRSVLGNIYSSASGRSVLGNINSSVSGRSVLGNTNSSADGRSVLENTNSFKSGRSVLGNTNSSADGRSVLGNTNSFKSGRSVLRNTNSSVDGRSSNQSQIRARDKSWTSAHSYQSQVPSTSSENHSIQSQIIRPGHRTSSANGSWRSKGNDSGRR